MGIDPYQVLGVSPTCTGAELKAAWHRRLKQYHPDQFQQASPQVRAAAEDMTKLLNVAYDEIQAGTSDDGRRKHTFERRLIRFFSARELVQRSHVACEYADALVNRWRTTANLVRNAEHALGKIHAELRQHRGQTEALFNLVFSGAGIIDHAVTTMLEARLVKEVTQQTHRLRTVVQQINEQRASKTYRPHFTETLENHALQLASELSERLPTNPQAVTALLTAIGAEAHRSASIIESRIASVERDHRDAMASKTRARTRIRQAISEARGFKGALNAARQAVDHVILVSWTAHGLCQVEEQQASDAEEKWRTGRTLDDAVAVKAKADELEAQQSIGERLALDEDLGRLKSSKTMLDEILKDCTDRIEKLKHWQVGLAERLERVGPIQMAKLEQQIGPAFALSMDILTKYRRGPDA
ncbi:MAG: J domain-containing protein [Myxococcota bacterium]|nr:J domain-containing protein [Myxococcota bacterium]